MMIYLQICIAADISSYKTKNLGEYWDEIIAAKIFDYVYFKLIGKKVKLNFPNNILTREEFKQYGKRCKNNVDFYQMIA